VPEAPNGVTPGMARVEVASVLASTLFSRAPTLSRILKYVCDQHFLGRAGDIKEYSIAVEALGRSADFDPADDSIVRVEAARLRRHLRKYYETDGASHSVQIRIADVGYAPQFLSTGPAKSLPAAGAEAPEGQPAERRSRPWWLLPALVLAGAVLLGLAFATTRTAGGLSLGALFSPRPSPPAIPTPESGIRIRVGSSHPGFLDANAVHWLSDRYFDGGRLGERNRPVEGTQEPGLYNGSRWGNFTYAIPVANGTYRVRLHFAEIAWGPNTSQGGGAGSRLFDVYCNGRALRTRFDLFGEAGGEDRAVELVFRHLTPNAQNKLVLSFVPIVDYAVISAIEVEDEGA